MIMYSFNTWALFILVASPKIVNRFIGMLFEQDLVHFRFRLKYRKLLLRNS